MSRFRLPRRNTFIIGFLLSLGIVLGWLSLLAWHKSQQSTLNDQAAVYTVKADSYGVATSFSGLSQSQIADRMASIKATGAIWVRFDLDWSAVQIGGPNSYNWSTPDTLVAASTKAGLQPIMVVGLAPTWERPAGCTAGERCGINDASAYGKFAGIAAARYTSLGVHTWELWNEPNIAFRFGPATDPTKYVAMLQSAYPAIKKADPRATVLAGDTAPAATANGDMRPDDFLAAMYNDGAKGYFDAIAVHPYTYPLTPAQSSLADAWGQMTGMHQQMMAHGDGSKLIWITEFGAPTGGSGSGDVYVSETVQAQTMLDAARLFRMQSWSGPLMWYNWQDSTGASSENYYGLLHADGSHKPSYDAFVQAIKQY